MVLPVHLLLNLKMGLILSIVRTCNVPGVDVADDSDFVSDVVVVVGNMASPTKGLAR